MKRVSIITHKCIRSGSPVQCHSFVIPKKPIIKITTLPMGTTLATYHKTFTNTLKTTSSLHHTTKIKQHSHHMTTVPERHYDKGIVEQNKKLLVLCKEKKQNEAVELFNSMVESKRFDLSTFNMMIEFYYDGNHGSQMRQLFRELLSIGLKPDQRTYGTFLRYYYKINSFNQVVDMWNNMLKDKIPVSLQNLNTVMLALNRSQRYEEITELYKYVKEDNLYDQSIYTSIIDAYARCGKADDVHKLYQEMQKRGILPNLKTFYSIFSALSQVQDDEKLEYYKQEMETHNIKENGMLYMFQLEYHAKQKNLAGVLDTLMKIESDSTVKMSPSFVRILVDSIGRCDRAQDMINYVSTIERAGVPPYLEVYITIIKHLDRLVSPQNAIQMYNIAVNHKKLKPTPELLNIMLKIYARAKDKQGVNTILEEFRKNNTAPDLDALNSAMEVQKGK